MKFFVLFVLGAFTVSFSAGTASDFKIGDWANFCQAAVSHTFDDGTGNQFSKAMPLFDAKGYKMTFATVTSGSMMPGWDKLKSAFAKGHEVASHSVSHPQTADENELKNSQATIRSSVPGEKCVSMVFPNCNPPSAGDNVTKKYYIVARVCGGGPEGKTPGNMFRTACQIVGQGGASTDLDGYAKSALNKSGWAVFLHHGVDGDHNWASTSSSAIGNHLGFLDKNRDKYWVETYGNVARYIYERDSSKITLKSSDDKSFTITVTNKLSDSIFNYPLSIRRELPSGWTTAVVTQNAKPVDDSIVTVDTKKYVMFKAVPNAGDIVISKDATGTFRNHSYTGFEGASPIIRQHAALVIDQRQFNGSGLSVSIFDLTGKALARHSIQTSESSVVLPTDEFGGSAFVVKIIGGNKTYIKMFMPQL